MAAVDPVLPVQASAAGPRPPLQAARGAVQVDQFAVVDHTHGATRRVRPIPRGEEGIDGSCGNAHSAYSSHSNCQRKSSNEPACWYTWSSRWKR